MRKQDWTRFIGLCAPSGAVRSCSFAYVHPCSDPRLPRPGDSASQVWYWRPTSAPPAFDTKWREHRGLYLRIGLLASAVPFSCFVIGALQLPASLLGILNACTPLFGSIFAAIWLRWKRAFGVFLGLLGVTLANGLGNVELNNTTFIAIGITVIAPLCYALSGVFIKLRANHLPSEGIAAWSQLMVGPRGVSRPARIAANLNSRTQRIWRVAHSGCSRECAGLFAFLSLAG